MNKRIGLTVISCSLLIVMSCHKKNYPAKTSEKKIENGSDAVNERNEAKSEKKTLSVRKPKVAVAKVITVDDNAAHKSVDGRLYYDVLGRRYWKNYNDGKYYLFNKAMYSDPAFKPK